MKSINLETVQEATEFSRPTAGGYICQIYTTEDVADKEYLRIEYDIAEGPFKGHYFELYKAKGFWGASFIKSYKDTALPFFKAFVTAIESSNKGYKWDNDESKLRNKYIGLVLGEEEYQKNDGTVGTRLYVDKPRSVDAIRSGDFKVPEKKFLDGNIGRPTFTEVSGNAANPWDNQF